MMNVSFKNQLWSKTFVLLLVSLTLCNCTVKLNRLGSQTIPPPTTPIPSPSPIVYPLRYDFSSFPKPSDPNLLGEVSTSWNPGFSAFTMTVQTPLIADFSQEAYAGETVVIAGARFEMGGTPPVVWVFGPLKNPEAGNSLGIVQATVVQESDTMVTATIPPVFEKTIYYAWVDNGLAKSRPVRLNAPEARWLGPLGNTVAAGGVKRIFGVNLGTTPLVVLVASSSKRRYAVTVTSAGNPFNAEFKLPVSIPLGNYEVWLHNGEGAEFGWSRLPDTLHVVDVASPPPPSQQIDLRNQGTVTGDMILEAIEDANENGGAVIRLPDGSWDLHNVLTLKTGVWIMGNGKAKTKLRIKNITSRNPRNAIRILGDNVHLENLGVEVFKMSSSSLCPHENNQGIKQCDPSDGLVGTYENSISFKRQSFVMNNVSLKGNASALNCKKGNVNVVCFKNNSLFINASIITQSEWGRVPQISGQDNLVSENLFLGGPNTQQLTSCTGYDFGSASGGEAGIHFSGAERTIIEGNTVHSIHWKEVPQVGDQVAKRYVLFTLEEGSNIDNYIGGGTSINTAIPCNSNKGEMVLFHSSDGFYDPNKPCAGTTCSTMEKRAQRWNQVLSSTSNSVKVSTQFVTLNNDTFGIIDGQLVYSLPTDPPPSDRENPNYSPAYYSPTTLVLTGGGTGPLPADNSRAAEYIFVVGGKGFGQMRRILSHTQDTITVDTPWNISPDYTSKISLGRWHVRNLVVNNQLSGFPDSVYAVSGASMGVQIDANGWKNTVANNQIKNTLAASRVGGLDIAPSLWNNFRNNTYQVQRSGLSLVNLKGDSVQRHLGFVFGPVLLGNTFREEKIQIQGPEKLRNQDWASLGKNVPPSRNFLGYHVRTWPGRYWPTNYPMNIPAHNVANVIENNQFSGGRSGLLLQNDFNIYRSNTFTLTELDPLGSSPEDWTLPSGKPFQPIHILFKASNPSISENTINLPQ